MLQLEQTLKGISWNLILEHFSATSVNIGTFCDVLCVMLHCQASASHITPGGTQHTEHYKAACSSQSDKDGLTV
jgi:hypothetical protein